MKRQGGTMKRFSLAILVVLFASLFAPTALRAQRFYTNAKPMTFAYQMNNLWTTFKVDVTRFCDATPEDKFFATPPGYHGKGGDDETGSIGGECAHAADEMENM